MFWGFDGEHSHQSFIRKKFKKFHSMNKFLSTVYSANVTAGTLLAFSLWIPICVRVWEYFALFWYGDVCFCLFCSSLVDEFCRFTKMRKCKLTWLSSVIGVTNWLWPLLCCLYTFSFLESPLIYVKRTLTILHKVRSLVLNLVTV